MYRVFFLKKILPLIVHLSPIIPFLAGTYYLLVANVLFVLLVYIKVGKLESNLKSRQEDGKLKDREKQSMEKALKLWKSATFSKGDS